MTKIRRSQPQDHPPLVMHDACSQHIKFVASVSPYLFNFPLSLLSFLDIDLYSPLFLSSLCFAGPLYWGGMTGAGLAGRVLVGGGFHVRMRNNEIELEAAGQRRGHYVARLI
ncbi:hypothetical protein OG21DRAFT_750245 [Imleria badia]|nr:hypothetical protein OG21DRAFT_750245 [Imleria badia]